MSKFTTPARARFPRSSMTGNVPDVVAAGSLSINWPDKKIYVGGPNGVPIRFSQFLEDWATSKAYKSGDFVIFQGDIWRAEENVPAASAFVETQWQRLTDSGRSSIAEPISTGIIEGGEVTVNGAEISVTAGAGLIVDNTDPANIGVTPVSWSGFTITLTLPATPWSLIAINSAGGLIEVPQDAYGAEFRRDNVLLGAVYWDGAVVAGFDDFSRRVAGTAETYLDEYEVNGGAYLAQGGPLSVGTGPLTLALGAGSVFSMGGQWRTDTKNPNILEFPPLDPITFLRVTSDNPVVSGQTEVDPTQYDAGGGTLASVMTGQATIQYVFATSDMQSYWVQYGQTVYSGTAVARSILSEDWDNYIQWSANVSAILIGAVILESGEADISSSLVVRARRGANPFENQSGLDTSDLYLLDGGRPLTGDMDADGFAILSAVLDGENNLIQPLRSEVTGFVPAITSPDASGELFINRVDGKTYMRDAAGMMVQVGGIYREYASALQYRTGDTCIHSLIPYIANKDTTGAFVDADWDAVGSQGASNAVVVDPDAAGRNAVVTTGDVEGLILDGDMGQTANLLQINPTQAGDTQGSYVDAQSFPQGHFAPQVYRIAQPSHLFTAIGQPAMYNATDGYRPSDGSDVTVGLIDLVIDANTFVIRTSGQINNLEDAAFAGGSLSPARSYYVSATVSGQLTTVARTDGQGVILFTSGGRTGIVLGVVASVGADTSLFVAKAGDTMTGDLRMSGEGKITFNTTSEWIYRPDSTEAVYIGVGGQSSARVYPQGTAMPSSYTVVTREKGDARYLELSGGVMNGTLNMSGEILTGASVVRTSFGTADAPSHSFTSDINTGMYAIAQNEIGFSTGGGERVKITGSGVEVSGDIASSGAISAGSGITAGAAITTASVATASEIRASDLGSATDAAFTFVDNQTTGMYATDGGDELAFTADGRYGLQLIKRRADEVEVKVRDWLTYNAPVITGVSANLHLDYINTYGVDNLIYGIGSSIRYKEDVRPIEADWKLLNPVAYTARAPAVNAGDTSGWGFIAEEIHAIAPEMADVSEEGEVQNYKDRHVAALMAKGMLELLERVEQLEAKLHS